jgi:PAS domain S-box-containing protein
MGSVESAVTHPTARQTDPLFAGPGEMRALCRSHDWAATSLGPVSDWPISLRSVVSLLLGSRNPMFLFWGPDLIQFYNDAYRPSLGSAGPDGRHPRALGMHGREFWTDIWEAIGPQIEQVMTTGEATWHEDQYLPIERNGRLDDVWWTYSYGPVIDDDGRVNGVLVVCQETTQRVVAERERERLLSQAAQAHRRIESILDQIADEHLTMDADFRILTVNRAAVQALDTPRDALVGLTHWEAFPASIGTHVEQRYRRVMRDRVEAHFTHHYVGEGHDRFLEIDAYPTDEGGIALFWRDVSKRVRAETALRESEALLRAIFDATYEYIGLITPDGDILDCNRASLEFAGNTRDDVVGVKFWDSPWFAHTPGAPAQLRASIARAAAGEFVRYEATLLRPTGEPVTFDFSLHPVRDADGNIVFIVPEGRNITDRKRAEEALRESEARYRTERARLAEVFRQAPSFLAVLRGPHYIFELANDAYYSVVGHRRLVGLPLLEAMPEMRDQVFLELLDRVRDTGEPYVGHEVPIQLARTPGAEPEERFVDFVYQPLTEADGTVSGIAAHGHDVTEQVRSRREIERLLAVSEQARAEAEAANHVKAQFLTTMSHELRTPLNAIGGYTELLHMGIRGRLNQDQEQFVERIQSSQRHLLGLINEVLSFAKLETGAVRYRVTDVDVRAVLDAAQSLVMPQALARGLQLTPMQSEAGLLALADAEKLRQIVVNLLSNAVKFTQSGGSISLSAERRADLVHIAVSDTGIGIEPDKQSVIFDPFVQVHSELTRPYDGTGLGLAISRDLARAMGGDLTVVSTFGQGSTFTLTLPAA